MERGASRAPTLKQSNILSNISSTKSTSKELSNRRVSRFINADQLNESNNDKCLLSVNLKYWYILLS